MINQIKSCEQLAPISFLLVIVLLNNAHTIIITIIIIMNSKKDRHICMLEVKGKSAHKST